MAYGPMYGATQMAVQDKYKKKAQQQPTQPQVGAGAPTQQPTPEPPPAPPAPSGTVQPPPQKGSYLKQPQQQVEFQAPPQPTPQRQPPEEIMPLGGSWLDPWKERAGEVSDQMRDWSSEMGQGISDFFGGLAESGLPDTAGLITRLPESAQWDDKINDYLNMVFGDEASFDPQQELLEEQRDKAMRQSMERMAAQGMLGTGAAGGAAQDIMRGAARDIAQARQDWHQQQVGNAAQAASMLFQDSWKHLDYEHQKGLASFMFELERRRKYGDDYNPDIGDVEMNFLMDLLGRGELSGEEERLVREGLMDMYPDIYQSGDMTTWPVPGPGDNPWVIDANGDVWGYDRKSGEWRPHSSNR